MTTIADMPQLSPSMQADAINQNFHKVQFWASSANPLINGAVQRTDTIDWSVITGTPTTLAGYGIADAQPLDAELTAIAGLTSASDRLPYFTGSGAASLATFTSAGRALIDDADATAQRVTLSVSRRTISAVDPSVAGTEVGEDWYNTASGVFYIWDGTKWSSPTDGGIITP